MSVKSSFVGAVLAVASVVTTGVFWSGGQVAAAAASGESTTHVVTAQAVRYAPMFLYIEPGDQVSWQNMIGHNVETIDSMVPAGQEKIESELGANVTATFDTVGIVVYKCTPHWSARMGGIIVVGKPENPAEIIDAYFAAIEADPSTLPAKGLLKKLRSDMEEKGFI